MATPDTIVWFLIIDHQNAPIGNLGEIAVPSGSSVYSLARKVKEENPSRLANVDAGELTIWKWLGALGVARQTLYSQLEHFERREGARLFEAPQSLEDIQWSSKNDLLVVRKPGPVPPGSSSSPQSSSERRPIGQSQSIEGAMAYIHEYLWGSKDNLSKIRAQRSFRIPDLDELQEHQAEDGTTDDVMAVDNGTRTTNAFFYDLSLIPSFPQVASGVLLETEFYERQEYRELDHFLEAQRKSDVIRQRNGKPPRPVFLTGQPGIGKTVYLTYCLVKRLVERKPTLLAISSKSRYVFFEDGVHLAEDFDRWKRPEVTETGGGYLDGLVLFDLNAHQSISTTPVSWRLLVASSPKPQETRGWIKEHRAVEFYMKTWSWEEIYSCTKLRAVEKRPSDEDWCAAFLKYGGSAGLLLEQLESDLARGLEFAIQRYDPSDLVKLTLRHEPDKYSHRLVEINPKTDKHGIVIRSYPYTQIISRFIFSEIMEKKEDLAVNFIRAMMQEYLKDPETKAAAGICLKTSGTIISFERLVKSLEDASVQCSLDLKHLDKDMEQFKGHKPPFASQSGIRPTKYYRPNSRNFPGIDSFAFENSGDDITGVAMFQFTVSPCHSVNTMFIEKLWKVLPLPGQRMWKLVFVIPEDEDDGKWQGKMTISDKTLEKKISQFVFKVNLDDIWSTIRKSRVQ